VLFWPWRAAVVSSSPERLDPHRSPLTSVLAFHGQHACALGKIALAEFRPDFCWRWRSRLVATPSFNASELAQLTAKLGGRRQACCWKRPRKSFAQFMGPLWTDGGNRIHDSRSMLSNLLDSDRRCASCC